MYKNAYLIETDAMKFQSIQQQQMWTDHVDHHHHQLDLTLRLGLPNDVVSDRTNLNPLGFDNPLTNSIFITPNLHRHHHHQPINLNSNVPLIHQPAQAMDWYGKVLGSDHNVGSESNRGIYNIGKVGDVTPPSQTRNQTHLKLNYSNRIVGDYCTKNYKNAFPPPPKMNVEYVLLNPSTRRSHRRPGGSVRRRTGRRHRRPVEEDPSKRCTNYNCATSTTPMWRKGPLGPKTLCNACGIKYRKQEEKRKEREEAEQVAKEPADNNLIV